MSALSRDFILQSLQGRGVTASGATAGPFTGVSIDSRTVEPGALYVALRGERLDGHVYVGAALAGGAAAALVARGTVLTDAPSDAALFIVDDTLQAMQDLAHAHLLRLPARRIALTGSNGKTTTKELVAAALRASYGDDAVLATEGNLNNHIGLPLTALRATTAHRAVVLEMGMNHLGEIETLCRIAEPEIGLVTNIGSAHAGNVGGIEGVAQAKGELFEALASTGRAIVNADDARCVREAQARSKARALTFGTAATAAVRIVDVREHEHRGLAVTIAHAGAEARVHIPLDGRHNAVNAAAAVACALALGLPFSTSMAGIAHVHAAHGRLERTAAASGALLLDDTYNANPDSMLVGLDALVDLAGDRRRVVVLGQMLELGDDAERQHRDVGAAAVSHGAALLFACGALGRHYGDGALAAGLPPSSFFWAQDSATLAPLVQSVIQASDAVLVKGSRGARMELVIDVLRGREGPR